MNEKYVVNLRDVAIYHADNPFGSCSEKKLLQRGEMVLSEVNLSVAPGEFVYLIGRVGSGKSSLLKNGQDRIYRDRSQRSEQTVLKCAVGTEIKFRRFSYRLSAAR